MGQGQVKREETGSADIKVWPMQQIKGGKWYPQNNLATVQPAVWKSNG